MFSNQTLVVLDGRYVGPRPECRMGNRRGLWYPINDVSAAAPRLLFATVGVGQRGLTWVVLVCVIFFLRLPVNFSYVLLLQNIKKRMSLQQQKPQSYWLNAIRKTSSVINLRIYVQPSVCKCVRPSACPSVCSFIHNSMHKPRSV